MERKGIRRAGHATERKRRDWEGKENKGKKIKDSEAKNMRGGEGRERGGHDRSVQKREWEGKEEIGAHR